LSLFLVFNANNFSSAQRLCTDLFGLLGSQDLHLVGGSDDRSIVIVILVKMMVINVWLCTVYRVVIGYTARVVRSFVQLGLVRPSSNLSMRIAFMSRQLPVGEYILTQSFTGARAYIAVGLATYRKFRIHLPRVCFFCEAATTTTEIAVDIY
jgi:hypothetical protein